jgi:hypothetical protein
MSLSTSVGGEPRFAAHLKAADHFLIRGAVWLSAIGAVCAGGGYVAVHSSPPPDNFYPGVIGMASLALGVAFLILGVLCRGIARFGHVY